MSNIARHIAIVMDGNGRWAEERGEKRVKGHEKGAEVVRELTTFCSNHESIKRLTLYAFSTENWKRPKLEVEFLMKLLQRYLKNELHVYMKENVRFEPIGDLSGFSKSLQKTIQETKDRTASNTGLIQTLALNYGAKDEIVRAVKKMNENNIEITEENLNNALDLSDEVDVFIRTGGDVRISNYLIWQCAYAEMFFTPTLWPDFKAENLTDIIEQFISRERRFGGLK